MHSGGQYQNLGSGSFYPRSQRKHLFELRYRSLAHAVTDGIRGRSDRAYMHFLLSTSQRSDWWSAVHSAARL